LKNKEIKQILKNAGQQTDRVISEQFPANWDLESAFQKSYVNYLRQTDPAEARKKRFRFSRNTGFDFQRRAIAACLLLTLCTTGTIIYLQHRADEPDHSVTVQTESIPIAFTEITASVTTAPQTSISEAKTKQTQISETSSAGTTTATETVRAETQTASPDQQPEQGSSPSEPDALPNGTVPVHGTDPDLPVAASARQTETHTTAAPAVTQAQPPEQQPENQPVSVTQGEFITEDTGRSEQLLRFRPETQADITPKQFTVNADGCSLTETYPLTNGEQSFSLSISGVPQNIEVSRYSYELFEISFYNDIHNLLMNTRNGKQICTVSGQQTEPDSPVIFLWAQDESVFMLTAQARYTDRINSFIDGLEGHAPS